jgi:hypothetical protein
MYFLNVHTFFLLFFNAYKFVYKFYSLFMHTTNKYMQVVCAYTMLKFAERAHTNLSDWDVCILLQNLHGSEKNYQKKTSQILTVFDHF